MSDPLLQPDLPLLNRPRTRAECPARTDEGLRVCPWLSCQYHVGLHIGRGRRVILHPALRADWPGDARPEPPPVVACAPTPTPPTPLRPPRPIKACADVSWRCSAPTTPPRPCHAPSPNCPHHRGILSPAWQCHDPSHPRTQRQPGEVDLHQLARACGGSTCARDHADDGPKTLEEIASTLGRITRERVRQIEAEALRKLRRRLPPRLLAELRDVLAASQAIHDRRAEGDPSLLAAWQHGEGLTPIEVRAAAARARSAS